MISWKTAATGLALAFLAAGPVSGAEMRFDMHKDGDRWVRLDRQTGAISVCREERGELVCRMSAVARALASVRRPRFCSGRLSPSCVPGRVVVVLGFTKVV